MYETFKKTDFSDTSRYVINKADGLITHFQNRGFTLTVRQLYYQFVGKDLFPDHWRYSRVGGKWRADPDGTKNAEPNYKRLCTIINKGRLAGLIDWEGIEDRMRGLEKNTHWDTGAEIMHSAANSFAIDKWDTQDTYIEVWVEKDALAGVVERICSQLDISFLACRGYTSQSELWRAGHRMREAEDRGKGIVVIHLGDHDPSGIDMTRDNEERLALFSRFDVQVERIALNMDQVRQYNLPPDPAKSTDSRFRDYRARYGDECWELDALDPQVIQQLIAHEVGFWRDDEAWDEAVKREREVRAELKKAADQFEARGV